MSEEGLLIRPLTRPPDATIRVPGSKSITNRALLIAALARGSSSLEGMLFSDDTRYMAESLRRLGAEQGRREDRRQQDDGPHRLVSSSSAFTRSRTPSASEAISAS